MPGKIYIPEMFAEIVDNLNQHINIGYTSKFSYGHYADVVKELKQIDGAINGYVKYPLIWLVMDYVEKTTEALDEECELHNIQILIVCDTDANYSMTERMNVSFKSKLYFIYKQLLKEIVHSGYFKQSVVSKLSFEKIDRPYWGGGGENGSNGAANLFSDYVDAIQIRNLSLNLKRIKTTNCSLKQIN